MFDHLYQCPFALARHRNGPMLEERIAFLASLVNQGYARRTLRTCARHLLVIAHTLGLARRPRKPLLLATVKCKMANRRPFFGSSVFRCRAGQNQCGGIR